MTSFANQKLKLEEVQFLPLFPLPGALLLPNRPLPLNIFEPRYLQMIDDALAGARLIGMIQPRSDEGPVAPPLYTIGCAGRITAFSETEDGRYLITLSGQRRFAIESEISADTAYRLGEIRCCLLYTSPSPRDS